MDIWDELATEIDWKTITPFESPLRGKLYKVKATQPITNPLIAAGITIGNYEAHTPEEAINRCFADDPRKRSSYRNWEAVEIPYHPSTRYKNLEGMTVLSE